MKRLTGVASEYGIGMTKYNPLKADKGLISVCSVTLRDINKFLYFHKQFKVFITAHSYYAHIVFDNESWHFFVFRYNHRVNSSKIMIDSARPKTVIFPNLCVRLKL